MYNPLPKNTTQTTTTANQEQPPSTTQQQLESQEPPPKTVTQITTNTATTKPSQIATTKPMKSSHTTIDPQNLAKPNQNPLPQTHYHNQNPSPSNPQTIKSTNPLNLKPNQTRNPRCFHTTSPGNRFGTWGFNSFLSIDEFLCLTLVEVVGNKVWTLWARW